MGTEAETRIESGHGSGIFGNNCDRYWNAGLPVIPLAMFTRDQGVDGKPTGKAAIPSGWSAYCLRMPTPIEQVAWKSQYHDNNIGLPLGKESGLIAVDIDTVDPKLLAIIDQVLPYSPWKRVGKKGRVQVYKWEGQKITRIKGINPETGKSESLLEILSTGSQIVIPPSIHPDTGRPYYANADLVDVLDDVRPLPPGIETLLRDAFTRAGYKLGGTGVGAVTNYISTGNRDNTVVQLAGLFARDVLKGEKTLKEALGQIETHIREFTAKTYGDDIDPLKGPQKLLEFLIRDVTGPKLKVLPKGWDDGVTEEERKTWGLDDFSKENESWNYSQVLAYFDAHIEKEGVRDNTEQLLGVVKRVLMKVSSHNVLDAIEEDQLLSYIASVSGRKVTLASLRKQMNALRRGTIQGTSHAEIAQQIILDLQEVGGEIRYDFETLWQWEGSSWVKMDESKITKQIITEYGEMKAATRASDHAGILRTIKGATAKKLVQRPVAGINFVNGFLTEDLVMEPHHPDFGCTYYLPYAYDPDKVGKATRWAEMLHNYWGDDPDYAEKVTALGELMALTMFSRMPDVQLAVCLYGIENSGKSRIIEIMQALMPDQARAALPPTMWGDRFGPAELVGKLLNVAGELHETQYIDSAMFKQIVEGAEIQAQRKNQPLFTFRPRCAHWFASNHTPRTKDSSAGFTRRWIFLTFRKQFPASQDIKNYDKIVVSEEREAIAAWAVSFMAGLQMKNFRVTDPPSSMATREALENELNTVRDFLAGFREQGRMLLGAEPHSKRGIPDDRNFTTANTLYNEYRSYCMGAGVLLVGSRQFSKRMGHLAGKFGFMVDKVSGPLGTQVEIFRYLTLVNERDTKKKAA